MSDDEADPELLELLRQSLGISRGPPDEISPDTGVLKDAEFIYNNSIDVSIDMSGTKAAAQSIYAAMQERSYSTQTWSEHELHPTPEQGFSEIDIVNFVFTMDLLNFSFWSSLSEADRFQVEYKDKRCTGYKSLLACVRRALDENIPITTPRFWNHPSCTDELLRKVFRSSTDEEMPLLSRRMELLREAGQVLSESFGDPDPPPMNGEVHPALSDHANGHNLKPTDVASIHSARPVENGVCTDIEGASQGTETANIELQLPEEAETSVPISMTEPIGDLTQGEANQPDLVEVVEAKSRPDTRVISLIEKADRSAGKLVNLLVKHFSTFRDEARFDGKKVRIYKRAQILVADLWAALNGTGYGEFGDIDNLTMFADYRVLQILRSLGVLVYSPVLEYAIRDGKVIPSGHSWEVQMRGCSIWAVELIRREIMRQHPDTTGINAVLIDFFLYDLAKEKEAAASPPQPIASHHRTRSEYY